MKGLFPAILLVLCGEVYADGPRPQPGLWELKVVKQVMDGRDMQPQMAAAQEQMQKAMANMPPEQRKRMEAMMGSRGSAGGVRICISKEMAARDKPVMDPQSHCETTKFDRSGNQVRFELKCSNEGRTQTGKGVSTIGSESVESVMDMTMADARGSHTVHSETQMKFIGSDCQGIKPADQMAKEMPAR